jgi:tetratricopeptide (TPR) repeat protein
MVVVLLVVSIAALSLMDVFRGRAINTVEDFSTRYESLRSLIHEEHSDGEEEHSHGEVEELLAELESFAKKNSGYAGGRAWSIIGNIRSERKEWAESEAAWAAAAGKSAKNYLAPVAWFNAGVAAEQQEKFEQAIDYYTRCLSAPAGFSSAPRAQFSIGRLRETLGETDEAIDAYRAVITGWPQDQVWTNLAYSKIIALEL